MNYSFKLTFKECLIIIQISSTLIYKTLSDVFAFLVTANLFLALDEGGCYFSNKKCLIKMGLLSKLKDASLLRINFKIMANSLLFRIFSLSLVHLLFVSPFSLRASEIDSSPENSIPTNIEEVTGEMTQKQMNDLFGEDPYLGQTSYLQSPDGFSQREKSK